MKWISCDDEMPEFHKEILFFAPCDNIEQFRMGAFYRKSHKFIASGDKYYKEEVSHWLYPEPPNELNKG